MSIVAEVPTLTMESVNANTVTMFTVFLTFVTVFTPSVAAREYTKHGSLSNDAGLLMNLMKRLGNDYNAFPSEKPEDAASRTSNSQSPGTGQRHSSCGPVTQSGVIIKATESMKAGADYIDSIKGVRSNSDCAEYCCRNATCDVAVYQDKEDRYCYLFNCHGKCQFKTHSNYFVNTMMMHPRLAEQSEEDLQNLSEDEQEDSSQDMGGPPVDLNENVNPAIDSNQPTVVEETSPKSFMPVSTQAPEPFIAPHSVGLQGYCSQDIHCEDPNAGCVDNNCLCKGSYYDKEGVCRKVCPPSNFECFELGTLSRGPECVPRSQVCDSYLQCADGSDEFNCDSVDFPTGVRLPKPSTGTKDQGSHGTSGHDLTKPHTQDDGDTAKGAKQPASPSKPSAETSSNKTKSSNTTSSANKTNTAATTPKAPTGSQGEKKHFFVSSEKVIIASSTSNAEGPIIALSLGLVFTLILLVLVGCRLRNMRQRLRKGRPLHQNEADYLINGMYL